MIDRFPIHQVTGQRDKGIDLLKTASDPIDRFYIMCLKDSRYILKDRLCIFLL